MAFFYSQSRLSTVSIVVSRQITFIHRGSDELKACYGFGLRSTLWHISHTQGHFPQTTIVSYCSTNYQDSYYDTRTTTKTPQRDY